HRAVRSCLFHGLRDSIKYRDALQVLPALAGGDAADNLGSVLSHGKGMEGAVPPGDSLHDDARVLADQDAHAYAFPARATTALTASVRSSYASMPAAERSCRPSASFVPIRRITSGTGMPSFSRAIRIPRAMSSQRVMPPNMLIRTARM